MDVPGPLGDAGGMERRADTLCPRCGWPTDDPFEVVSRHVRSLDRFGDVTFLTMVEH